MKKPVVHRSRSVGVDSSRGLNEFRKWEWNRSCFYYGPEPESSFEYEDSLLIIAYYYCRLFVLQSMSLCKLQMCKTASQKVQKLWYNLDV